MTNPGIDYFNKNAAALAAQYNALDRKDVHADLLAQLPEGKSLRVLDLGSGSGADAAMLADMGHSVTAVEPAQDLMALAQQAFPRGNIRWVSDTLPELAKQEGETFDVITSTGVLQYLDAPDRAKALSRIFSMAAKGGVIDLHYPVPASREHQFTVGHEEIYESLKAFSDIAVVVDKNTPDLTGRKALDGSPLSFRTVILRRGL